MKTSRQTRALTAWALYASVLFSLLVCGLHHGQMSGLRLAGLEGGFCSLASDHGPAIDLDDAGGDQHMVQLDCPVCSSFALAVPLSSAGWAYHRMQGGAPSPIVVRSWGPAPAALPAPCHQPPRLPCAASRRYDLRLTANRGLYPCLRCQP